MTRAELVEKMARAYEDTAQAITPDEWCLDPGACEIRCATAALDALAAAGRIVPDGWVAVPREPTSEMLEAGWRWVSTLGSYRAMLSAAPRPEDQA